MITNRINIIPCIANNNNAANELNAICDRLPADAAVTAYGKTSPFLAWDLHCCICGGSRILGKGRAKNCPPSPSLNQQASLYNSWKGEDFSPLQNLTNIRLIFFPIY